MAASVIVGSLSPEGWIGVAALVLALPAILFAGLQLYNDHHRAARIEFALSPTAPLKLKVVTQNQEVRIEAALLMQNDGAKTGVLENPRVEIVQPPRFLQERPTARSIHHTNTWGSNQMQQMQVPAGELRIVYALCSVPVKEVFKLQRHGGDLVTQERQVDQWVKDLNAYRGLELRIHWSYLREVSALRKLFGTRFISKPGKAPIMVDKDGSMLRREIRERWERTVAGYGQAADVLRPRLVQLKP